MCNNAKWSWHSLFVLHTDPFKVCGNEINVSLKEVILSGFDCSLTQIYMHMRTFTEHCSNPASCPRRTVIHPILICPSVCEGVWALISAACHFVCLSLCHCFARFMLLCCVLLCSAVLVLDGLPFNHDLLSFCLFPSFLSFPDLHIHSSYLLHLPFLHWEWQAGIPLTNSVFCTQQTPVRTLRGQSSAQHLPPCVCMYLCVCFFWGWDITDVVFTLVPAVMSLISVVCHVSLL